ncbi:helix-turn-helix domain-containing protein [Burkholderia ubonensis]|uniref:AlbA family DNA-binding domain-containing protein n=1 Tax=Burkholderia ubonensis TaxID=101571 RepID=UPI0009B3D6B0|nr:ATP-binding protein [Burkholderia ubonensis]
MLQKADIRDVTYDDLLTLKENQVPESHTLDYKREFPADRDARTSLACDVVAFANTRGGDLILGVQEERGVISNFKPINLTDRDASLLTLQSALTDLVEPKIPGIRLHAVPVPDGGYIVICRTPPSFQAPHRVRKTGVFYTRTSTGIDPMDITTLRSAFLQGTTATEKAKEFRLRRLGEVRAMPARGPLPPCALAVLHVVPIASILGSVSLGVDELHQVAQTTAPPRSDSYGPRVNFDGVMSVYDSRDQTFAYTQFFRNGMAESVMPVQFDGGDVAWVESFKSALIERHHEQLTTAFRRLGVDGPAFVMLSFKDIGGLPLERPNTVTAHIAGGAASIPKRYGDLLVPELYAESFTSTSADIYAPLFDIVWNAAGRRGAPRSP